METCNYIRNTYNIKYVNDYIKIFIVIQKHVIKFKR